MTNLIFFPCFIVCVDLHFLEQKKPGSFVVFEVEKPKATKKEEPAKVRGVNSEVRSWVFQFAASFYCREKNLLDKMPAPGMLF